MERAKLSKVRVDFKSKFILLSIVLVIFFWKCKNEYKNQVYLILLNFTRF
jgi:hypothetical protein